MGKLKIDANLLFNLFLFYIAIRLIGPMLDGLLSPVANAVSSITGPKE